MSPAIAAWTELTFNLAELLLSSSNASLPQGL